MRSNPLQRFLTRHICCSSADVQPRSCELQVGMIDFFLPYLPLERAHIRRLFDMRLRDEAALLRRRHRCLLRWGAPELDFLVSKVCHSA
jgi:hypothetical protein